MGDFVLFLAFFSFSQKVFSSFSMGLEIRPNSHTSQKTGAQIRFPHATRIWFCADHVCEEPCQHFFNIIFLRKKILLRMGYFFLLLCSSFRFKQCTEKPRYIMEVSKGRQGLSMVTSSPLLQKGAKMQKIKKAALSLVIAITLLFAKVYL